MVLEISPIMFYHQIAKTGKAHSRPSAWLGGRGAGGGSEAGFGDQEG